MGCHVVGYHLLSVRQANEQMGLSSNCGDKGFWDHSRHFYFRECENILNIEIVSSQCLEITHTHTHTHYFCCSGSRLFTATKQKMLQLFVSCNQECKMCILSANVAGNHLHRYESKEYASYKLSGTNRIRPSTHWSAYSEPHQSQSILFDGNW